MAHLFIKLALVSVLVSPFANAIPLNTIEPPQTYSLEAETQFTIPANLQKLALCESGGNPNIKHLDVNGRYSYGLFQWQADSFYRYNEKYKILTALERAEVLNVIYDPDVQIRLTQKVLEDGGWRNWWTCLHKYYELKDSH